MEKELDDIALKLTESADDALIARQDYLTNEFQKNGGLTYKSLTCSSLIGLGFDEKDFFMETAKLFRWAEIKAYFGKASAFKSGFASS